MQINAKIKKTGEQVTLKPYGFGYVCARGRFYSKGMITVLEVIRG
jgi:hypothetical protein